MSYKSEDERDKILENIKKSTKDFKNLVDRQKASLLERYQDEFEHEIKLCEKFNKIGDYFNAKLHFDRATSANELIKSSKKALLKHEPN